MQFSREEFQIRRIFVRSENAALQGPCLRSYDSTPSISVLNSAAMVAKGTASRKGKPMPQIE
jgi:hypothetical protein